jgi:acetyl esterase/lipase
VAILVHGGCWSREFGGIRQMRSIAAGLSDQGIAVWNIEYRRADEAGGGYPGTYQDINDALASLELAAPRLQLDLVHLVAIGHSAGGQLVQWMAGRERLPANSPVHAPLPLPVREIISLGGLADLRRQKARIARVCERPMVELTGHADARRPDPYVDTSAAELMPNGAHTLLVHGARDHQVPPAVGADYLRRARRAGDPAELLVLPGASHFDEVAFNRPAWQQILPHVRRAVGLDAAP